MGFARCSFTAAAASGVITLFLAPAYPAAAAATSPPSAAPQAACTLPVSASATSGSTTVTLHAGSHVIVSPAVLYGVSAYTVQLTPGDGQHWSAKVDDVASMPQDAANVAFDGTHPVHVVTLTSATCVSTLVVLQFGTVYASEPSQSTDSSETATVTEPFGQTTIGYDPSTGHVKFNVSSVATAPVAFTAMIDATVDGTELRFETGAAKLLILGEGQLVATYPLPAGSVPDAVNTTCSLLSALTSTAGSNLQISIAGTTIWGFSLGACQPSSTTVSLTAWVRNRKLWPVDVALSGTLGGGGTALSMPAGQAPLRAGSWTLSNPSIGFATPGATAQVTIGATLASTTNTKFTPTSVKFLLSEDGLSLSPESPVTVPLAASSTSVEVSRFQCAFNAAQPGLTSCEVTALLTFPNLAGSLTVTVPDSGLPTFAAITTIPLANDYRLQLSGLSVISASPLAVRATTALLTGGALGNSSIAVTNFLLKNGCVSGKVAAAAAVVAGPFKFSNISGSLLTCPPKGSMKGLDVHLDATLTPPVDPYLTDLKVNLKGFGVTIPLDGTAVAFSQPQSVTATGKLLGRTLVGVCPAALTPPAASSGVAALPSLALGQASVAQSDLKGPSFTVTSDGDYEVCLGFHLTPDAVTTTESTAAPVATRGTQDLVDARLLFGTDKQHTIKLKTAQITYVGVSMVTTRVGTSSFGIKALNLSYDPDGSGASAYGSVPANFACVAKLYGDVTMTIQSLAQVGSSESSIDTQLGLGDHCGFADVSGAVTIPVGNNSLYLQELHFGFDGAPSLPHPISFANASGRVYVGQGGFAFTDAGFVDKGDGKPPKPTFHFDKWGTIGMNVGWVVSGLAGVAGGILLHH